MKVKSLVRRLLLWGIIFVVVLVIGFVVTVEFFLPADTIREMAQSEGGRLLGREVRIGDISLSIWGGLGIRLESVAVTSTESDSTPTDTLLVADDIDLKMKLMPLLSGSVEIDRLVINRPRISLQVDENGNSNFDFASTDSLADSLNAAPSGKAAAAGAFSFDLFEINDGTIEYNNKGDSLRLTFLSVNLSTSLSNPREGEFLSNGFIASEKVTVSIGEMIPDLSLRIEYSAKYDATKGRLALEEARLFANNIRYDISGSVERLLEVPAATISVKSTSQSVESIIAMLPTTQRSMLERYRISGKLSVDGSFTYDPALKDSSVDYSCQLIFSNLALTQQDIPGEIRIERMPVQLRPSGLRTNIEGGKFAGKPFKAHIVLTDFAKPVVSGELSGSVDLGLLSGMFPSMSAYKLTGDATVSLKGSGPLASPEKLQYSGTIEIRDASCKWDSLPEPINNLRIEASFDKEMVNLRNAVLTFPSGSLTINTRIEGLAEYIANRDSTSIPSIVVDGTILGMLNLDLLNEYLPKEWAGKIEGYSEFDFQVQGETTDWTNLRPRGTINVSDSRYSDTVLAESIEKFNASLTLASDTLTISRFDVEFVSSDFSMTGKLAHPYQLLDGKSEQQNGRRALLLFDMSSRRFDFDKLFPEATPGSSPESTEGGNDSLVLAYFPNMRGEGTFKIDSLYYAEVPFSNVNGRMLLDGKVIKCVDVRSEVYSGTVSGQTTIDLSDAANPSYKGSFSAVRIEANDFLKRFSPMAGYLFGEADFSGNYSSQGMEQPAILSSLTMDSKAIVRNGRMKTSGGLKDVLQSLASKTGNSFTPEQAFKTLEAIVKVRDGKVVLEGLSTRLGTLGKVGGDGFYGFDGSVGYRGTISLSEKQSQKLLTGDKILSGLASLLADKKTGNTVLPFVIEGTLESPKVRIDYSAVQSAVGDKLKKKGSSLLEQLLPGKK